jgi:hypothetical protein
MIAEYRRGTGNFSPAFYLKELPPIKIKRNKMKILA